jgi:hypothetical protein
MKRLFAVILAAFAIVAATLAPAQAAAPTSITQSGGLHFVGTPDVSVQSSNTGYYLLGTGEVAGAGTTATATLSANAELVTGCINRGSKDQQPSGLERTTTPTLGTTTFRTRSGRGTFSVQTSPRISAASRTCPDQMTPVIVSLTFTDISLTGTSQTGTTTAFFPDLTAV